MFSFIKSVLAFALVVLVTLQLNAQCTGTISYVDLDSVAVITDAPVFYCFDDFDITAGDTLVSPINGIFIPFFVNTEAELTGDVHAGSTLTSNAGTIYDIVSSGRVNAGEATRFVQFINLQQADLQNESITISFTDATGDCKHELVINVANDLPGNIENTCETFECEFAFRIEYINWEEFIFADNPLAYCAEELTKLYPESNGIYNGGRTNAEKPGVYIPFLIRTNANAFVFEGASISTSNGAIYNFTEPPTPSDGSANSGILFLYLTEGNLDNNLININFTDSTGICTTRKTFNLSDDLPNLDLQTKCIPQNCGDEQCNGIEDYVNCPDDCPCNGSIEFLNWPELEVTEMPNFYCAESLDVDSIYDGGNTNMIDPGVYIPFAINTEVLPNPDNNTYEGSILVSNFGQIYNSTNPPSVNDSTASASVHFLYLTEADLNSSQSLRINFVDDIGGCIHLRNINIEQDLPGILPLPDCPCNSEIRFVNWRSKEFSDKPISYCAEQFEDFENWGTNIENPSVFIPFVIESGATLTTDSTTYADSKLTTTAGVIYNTSSPPSINDGEARVFIQMLALTKSDLENDNITINFEDPSGKCNKDITIIVPTDLVNVDPEVCLVASCGNGNCEAVEDYLNCPQDCVCEGSIQFLEFIQWDTLTLASGPTPYCIESVVPAGIEASTDTLNPGIFIPFTILTDAPVNEEGFFDDAKINATFGNIYDITVPPVEHRGNVTPAHYLYLAEEDLQNNGNEVQIAFSYSSNVCLHNVTLNLAESLPSLNARVQCLESECGNTICETAEDYSSCNDDCPCSGSVNYINWETKTDISTPKAYCFSELSTIGNQIDPTNESVFIPFIVRTNAVLGADSLYEGSQLGASIGTIYNNLEAPLLSPGTGSLFIKFLQLTKEEFESNDTSILSFENVNGDCKHQTTLIFSNLEVNFDACKEVGINSFEEDKSILINPNPAGNYLNVQFLNGAKHIKAVSIYNINSQLMEAKTIGSTIKNLQLNISTYNTGTYFINFEMKDGSVIAKRFAKK